MYLNVDKDGRSCSPIGDPLTTPAEITFYMRQAAKEPRARRGQGQGSR